MASATTRPASSTSGQVRGGGLVLFAFLMLRSLAAFNLIYGIAAVANPHVFIANAHYVFADLRTLGWITLIIGALQLLAAAGSWRATSWPLVRRGGAGAERHRHDVLPRRLPVLGTGGHRGGPGRAVRAMRPRQPRQPRSRLAPPPGVRL